MRIIAGKLGGRSFKSPNGHRVHPMSDKIRGALFNILGDIGGMTVLDAFSGSGALAYEAVSRGASNVVMIDKDRNAQMSIIDNISELKIDESVKLYKINAGTWLDNYQDNFDIVLLDPPYDQIQPLLLFELGLRTKIGGVVVLSLPPNASFEFNNDFNELVVKNYGDAELAFYRRLR